MSDELIHGLERQPKILERASAAAAFSRILMDGARFADPEAPFEPAELQAWKSRIEGAAETLVGTVESPLRIAILASLNSASVPDEANALEVMRINICGESAAEFAAACGLVRKTIVSVEEGGGCHIGSAAKIANRFGLGNLELFHSKIGSDGMRCRTVAGLREALESGEPALESDLASDPTSV